MGADRSARLTRVLPGGLITGLFSAPSVSLSAMNTQYRKPLPGTELEFLMLVRRWKISSPVPTHSCLTPRVLAEQLVRRCDPELLTDALKQLIERRSDLDFPLVPGASGVP
ncbi:hypothetical protein HORIV_44150 [Vreelandella olivaria]|uniref:Uncharacterized protein n=1 Tax=Vreelandella olivaria TaxID=390919 RepID=A0ABN5WYE9_9GAMM|nr:hypothetical protein HORIV_44150 [Halomonas olivaria]